MRKVIIRPNLDFKLTKEQEKERDEAWEALCNNGSICITDPMESTEELIQESRKGIHGKQPCIYLDDFFDGTDPRLRMAMADARELGLTGREAFDLLYNWALSFAGSMETSVKVYFTNNIAIGCGYFRRASESQVILQTSKLMTETVSDMDFLHITATLFHLFGHHGQLTSKNTPKEILISSLSIYENKMYYRLNWSNLLHEIDAEYTGVMSMLEHINTICPKHGEKLFLQYMSLRASDRWN